MSRKMPLATNHEQLDSLLHYLKLSTIQERYQSLAKDAATNGWTCLDYLENLVREEAAQRQQRVQERRIRQAHITTVKTLEQFNWQWPKAINEMHVKQLFRLQFIKDRANVIFLGGVGLGKTHLATALAYQACLNNYTALFITAVELINNLTAAHKAGRLKIEIRRYVNPHVLILDELGYLPIDKKGADLLFQVISKRYENGATVITSNRAYKDWAEIFNNDATLTSAILDRLLHHAETIVIDGNSYRMKDRKD